MQPSTSSPIRDSAPAKTIGLLGGMSPESTIEYYRRIQTAVRTALGGHHGPRMLIYSANLEDMVRWLDHGDEHLLGDHLAGAARGLERAGAEFLAIACNTAHTVAPQISAALGVPLIHIADVLGEALRRAGFRRIGLLATALTMEADFYRRHLRQKYAIETSIPAPAERQRIERIIMDELCFHQIHESSRHELLRYAEGLRQSGAEALVLGCTELGLILEGGEVAGLPVFDTTALHVERIADLALGRSELPAVTSARVA